MCVEKVRIGAATMTSVGAMVAIGRNISKEFAVYLISFVGPTEACPKINASSRRPAGSLFTFDFQAFRCGLGQLRRAGRGNLMTGEETDEVALVTMAEIEIVPIMEPFVQIAHVTDGIRT